jgi:hypothetical protein
MSVLTDRPPPPAATGDRGGGGGSGWIELVKARDDIDAHLLRGRLGEAGIDSRLVKDRFAPGAWLYGGSNPWAPVTVMVRRRQLEDARVVLAEISLDAPSAVAASRGPGGFKSRLWWVTALGLGALLSLIVLVQTAESLALCKTLPFCSATEESP